MIKLSEATARWIVFYLSQLLEATDADLAQRMGGSTPGGDFDGVLNDLWDKRCNYGFEAMSEAPARIAQELAGKLGTPLSDEQEVSLLDKVIGILSNPYARNILNGKTLEKLRKALLNPEEISKLQTRIEEATHTCANCGKEFELGEMGTSYSDLHGTGGRVFLCTRCRPPNRAACRESHCDGAVEFRYDFKKKCQAHKEGALEVAPAESPFDQIPMTPPIISATPSGAGQRASGRLRETARRILATPQPTPASYPGSSWRTPSSPLTPRRNDE